jgi:hypothetical protein
MRNIGTSPEQPRTPPGQLGIHQEHLRKSSKQHGTPPEQNGAPPQQSGIAQISPKQSENHRNTSGAMAFSHLGTK